MSEEKSRPVLKKTGKKEEISQSAGKKTSSKSSQGKKGSSSSSSRSRKNTLVSHKQTPSANGKNIPPLSLDDNLEEIFQDLSSSVKKPIGEILVRNGAIDRDQLAEALHRIPNQDLRTGEFLISKGITDEKSVQQALAEQVSLPFYEKLELDIDRSLVERLPLRFIKNYLLVPFRKKDRELFVAVYDPFDLQPLDDIRIIFQEYKVQTVVTLKREIEKVVTHFFEQSQAGTESMIEGLESTDMSLLSNMVEETRDLMEQDSESPIIQLVDAMISRAVAERASDIHIEPFEKDLFVRYRIDGILHEVLKPPKKIQSAIISRIKVMAKLNIAETRLPQDGRIQLKQGEKEIDIRISILPCYYGERVVMRLLNKTNVKFSLDSLGFEQSVLERFREQMKRTTGIILVTGPTGSGKSTTLYGALSELNAPEKNIMTIEDPVEYQIQGINQMHVRSQIDLTFARGLRAILRQDPDIVMVGEIRDEETARIAVQAALTGHLVFSTLHTNDAVSSLIRLVDMNVEPYLVNSSVIAFMAQRLTRVICDHCKTAYTPDDQELRKLDLDRKDLIHGKLFHGTGCDHCKNTGFSGRMMLNELLVLDDEIRDLLSGNASSTEIYRTAVKSGMRPMREDAKIKVISGYTTINEVLRVSI